MAQRKANSAALSALYALCPARLARLRRDDADVGICDPHPVQQRRLPPHAHHIARKQHRRSPSLAQAPHTVAQVVDAVSAFDAEGQTQFLTQPVFVKRQRRNVVGGEGNRPAFRALADAAIWEWNKNSSCAARQAGQ